MVGRVRPEPQSVLRQARVRTVESRNRWRTARGLHVPARPRCRRGRHGRAAGCRLRASIRPRRAKRTGRRRSSPWQCATPRRWRDCAEPRGRRRGGRSVDRLSGRRANRAGPAGTVPEIGPKIGFEAAQPLRGTTPLRRGFQPGSAKQKPSVTPGLTRTVSAEGENERRGAPRARLRRGIESSRRKARSTVRCPAPIQWGVDSDHTPRFSARKDGCGKIFPWATAWRGGGRRGRWFGRAVR